MVPKPRSQCSKPEQLVVTFIAGYIAGVFCAIVSHPADTIVSKLNQDKSATFMGVAKNLGWAGRCIFYFTISTCHEWSFPSNSWVSLYLLRLPRIKMEIGLQKRHTLTVMMLYSGNPGLYLKGIYPYKLGHWYYAGDNATAISQNKLKFIKQ